jgi:hypothetical protein
MCGHRFPNVAQISGHEVLGRRLDLFEGGFAAFRGGGQATYSKTVAGVVYGEAFITTGGGVFIAMGSADVIAKGSSGASFGFLPSRSWLIAIPIPKLIVKVPAFMPLMSMLIGPPVPLGLRLAMSWPGMLLNAIKALSLSCLRDASQSLKMLRGVGSPGLDCGNPPTCGIIAGCPV